jgi:hypothetical protein
MHFGGFAAFNLGEERGSDAEVVQIRLPRLMIDISIMYPTIAIYNS